MELLELKANIRTTKGNGPARALRRDGKIPAVLYGRGVPPVLLSVENNDLELALKKNKAGQIFFNLVIRNGSTFTKTAMIKELQKNVISKNFLHVDFFEISMDRKIRVKVPVKTTGKSKGVELGGTLQIVRREIEMMCLPVEIPEAIVIDIADLDIGDSIHVEDIPLTGNIETLADVNFTVITILSPKTEEEVEEEVEEGIEEDAETEESDAKTEKSDTAGE